VLENTSPAISAAASSFVTGMARGCHCPESIYSAVRGEDDDAPVAWLM
jgi:hypothetical protein